MRSQYWHYGHWLATKRACFFFIKVQKCRLDSKKRPPWFMKKAALIHENTFFKPLILVSMLHLQVTNYRNFRLVIFNWPVASGGWRGFSLSPVFGQTANSYSKASRYMASSCTDLAGASFWIGSKKIWAEWIYAVKTLSSTIFWSSRFHLIKHGHLNIWTELLYLIFPHEADLLTLKMSHKLTQYL